MNRKNAIIKIIAGLAALILFAGVLYYANYDRPRYEISPTTGVEYEKAVVLEVLEDNAVADESTENVWKGSMKLRIEILTGRYQGDTVDITNYFSALYNVQVREGDKLSVRVSTSGVNEYTVSVYNYYRVPAIIGCVLVFFLALVGVGGKKGLKAVGGLVFTVICILFIVLPLALKGFPTILVTLVIILISNLVSFFLLDGINTKTLISVAGSMGGVLFGAGFAEIAAGLIHVTTFQMEEAESLLLIAANFDLKIRGLFICGILIACMGAVMDVAISIASAVTEVHRVNPQLNARELFQSGMNIGRDAMGTMANTLILAFAGNSLNMMIMIYSYGVSFQQLMNTDFVAIEIIRAIAGSMGIVFTVPVVSAVSALVLGRRKKA